MLFGLMSLLVTGCFLDDGDFEVTIPDFDFPQSVVFEDSLSAYQIFVGDAVNLEPNSDFHLLELSSILFTDYAEKQRLVKVPAGTQIRKLSDGSIEYPDGSILVKTFFYYHDKRDLNKGKRIIESRLLIKERGIWNVATYLWNGLQTEAILELNGYDTDVSWVNAEGISRSTLYHVPDENECIACHQFEGAMTPIGAKLRNLNRMVDRAGSSVNQISHLQSVGIIEAFEVSAIPHIANYADESLPLADRGRVYLDLNCSHCHNPFAWEPAMNQDLDFRLETPLNQTGILDEGDEIQEVLMDQEMPFVGTTVLDEEGVQLIIDFINSL